MTLIVGINCLDKRSFKSELGSYEPLLYGKITCLPQNLWNSWRNQYAASPVLWPVIQCKSNWLELVFSYSYWNFLLYIPFEKSGLLKYHFLTRKMCLKLYSTILFRLWFSLFWFLISFFRYKTKIRLLPLKRLALTSICPKIKKN